MFETIENALGRLLLAGIVCRLVHHRDQGGPAWIENALTGTPIAHAFRDGTTYKVKKALVDEAICDTPEDEQAPTIVTGKDAAYTWQIKTS